ncbi:MAG: portal protein [Candidatus Thiodiazotropha endolucinida]|nr:portal protein [Candidatus Thiodiazotropha taylori]MCW4344834.1 portal protein [Candidatus Thiodiazotropha endolucinida]
MANIEDIIRIFDKLVGERSVWDSHWTEIGHFTIPRQSNIQHEVLNLPGGGKRTYRIYDSTAITALERFASIMESLLTPKTQKWHGITCVDPELNKLKSVKVWTEAVTDRLFQMRYRAIANFASQNYERWISTGAFGTATLFTDYYPNIGLRYRMVHMGSLYFRLNHQGIVDTVFRRLTYSLRQAIQKWGIDKLPEKLQKDVKNSDKIDNDYPFLHVVGNREKFDPFSLAVNRMPYYSLHICLTTKTQIDEGGYYSFPYAVNRYVIAPGETYGRSPAMNVLPDIKMLNEMRKSDIRAVHKMVDPPLLLASGGALSGIKRVNLTPGGQNQGGLDEQRRPTVAPLNLNARVDINEDKMERLRSQIKDAFLTPLFEVLVDRPRMSATEVLTLARERGIVLAPVSNQQTEALYPQIEREIDLLQRVGLLPEAPDEVYEAGGDIDIEFNAPINRLQRGEEIEGVLKTVSTLAPLADIDPRIFESLDTDATARLVAEVAGMPAKLILSEDELEKKRKDTQMRQDVSDMVNVAEPISKALKNTAQAQNLEG